MKGSWSYTYPGSANATADGAAIFQSSSGISMASKQESGTPAQLAFNASRISALYQDGLTDIRVNALLGMNLIRAF